MLTNKLQWKRIAEGDRLPCDALLMKKDGTIPSVISCAGAKVGQDAYYLPAEELRTLPKEESEDEMIRQMVLKAFKIFAEKQSWIGHCLDDIDWDKCIAYLEKQGKQKPTAEEVLIKAGLKPYKDGNSWCVLVGDNIQEGLCGFGDTIEDALYEFLKEVCKTRQKTVGWSKEDEYLLDETIKHLEVLIKISKKQGSAYSDEIQYYQRDIDWLKSLKERYTWKPSNVQMGALRDTIKHDLLLHPVLESLYNDLKILKG